MIKKILYYFADDHTFMTRWQFEHIFDELSHHNITIELFNPLEFTSINEANDKLIRRLTSPNDYDLFMTCCATNFLYKHTVQQLLPLSIPKVLICFDNLHAAYIHKEIMPYFDLVWLTSKENEDTIKGWGVNTLFMPYAANPYKFVPSTSKDIEKVCFIGTPYGTRCHKINQLIRGEIPVAVHYGKKNIQHEEHVISNKKLSSIDTDWKTLSNYLSTDIGRKILYSKILSLFGKQVLETNSANFERGYSLSFEEMVQSYSDYCLCLNVLELRNTYLLKNPIYKLHLRTFEIPMCGGIQFTSYNDELSGYYENGKEIVFYYSNDDYIDKARFYLRPENATIRTSIRKAARVRSMNEHTWWKRFEQIFLKLGV